jgi:hypothetical protein
MQNTGTEEGCAGKMTANELDQRQVIAMAKLTLESLAKRVEALERAVAAEAPKRARKVIGMFRDSEFMHAVDEECQRTREAERQAAHRQESPD